MRTLALVLVLVAGCSRTPDDGCATMRDRALDQLARGRGAAWAPPGQDGPASPAARKDFGERFVVACRKVGLQPRCLQEAEVGRTTPYCDEQLMRLARALSR
jgi:hypothetical protein